MHDSHDLLEIVVIAWIYDVHFAESFLWELKTAYGNVVLCHINTPYKGKFSTHQTAFEEHYCWALFYCALNKICSSFLIFKVGFR